MKGVFASRPRSYMLGRDALMTSPPASADSHERRWPRCPTSGGLPSPPLFYAILDTAPGFAIDYGTQIPFRYWDG